MMIKNIRPRNENGEAHGFWQVNWLSIDLLSAKSYHLQGQQVGYCEQYSYHFGGILHKTFSLI